MFLKKPKTRTEQIREDIERFQKSASKELGSTSKDVAKRLTRAADELRDDIENLMDNVDRKKARQMANDLESMASDLEKTAQKQITYAGSAASQNVWTTIIILIAVVSFWFKWTCIINIHYSITISII